MMTKKMDAIATRINPILNNRYLLEQILELINISVINSDSKLFKVTEKDSSNVSNVSKSAIFLKNRFEEGISAVFLVILANKDITRNTSPASKSKYGRAITIERKALIPGE